MSFAKWIISFLIFSLRFGRAQSHNKSNVSMPSKEHNEKSTYKYRHYCWKLKVVVLARFHWIRLECVSWASSIYHQIRSHFSYHMHTHTQNTQTNTITKMSAQSSIQCVHTHTNAVATKTMIQYVCIHIPVCVHIYIYIFCVPSIECCFTIFDIYMYLFVYIYTLHCIVFRLG